MFVIVAVHYVVAHAVVVEQVVYLTGPAQVQVCGVLPAVVVVIVVAAVIVVDGVVAVFVQVVVVLVDVVGIVVIVAVVAGSIAVVAPVVVVVPMLVLVASGDSTSVWVPPESNERNMGVAWA